MLRSLKGDEVGLTVSSVSSNDAAAGAEFLFTVPAGEKWLLKSVSVPLVQSATDTPWPTLVIDDGTNVIWSARSGTAAQAINTTCQHSWGPASPLTIAGATTAVKATGPLPEGLVLPAGYRIQSSTTGIAATANYGKAWAAVIKL
jgi:hypothetical protein